MISWLISSRLGRALTWALALIAGLAGLRLKWGSGGAEKALNQAKETDHANADAIRDRVERDLPDRVREFDGRGFRDD